MAKERRRVWGSRYYYLSGYTQNKKDANKSVAKLRREGYHARMVKVNNKHWDIWVHPRYRYGRPERSVIFSA